MKATQSRDTIDKTTNKCYNYLDRVTDTEKNDGRDERLSDEQNKNKLTDAEKTAEIELLSRSAFERAVGKSRRRLGRKTAIYIALLSGFCIALAVVLFAVFFRVKRVTVTGLTMYDDWRIIDASGITLGQNSYSISRASVEKAITESFPYVSAVTVRHPSPAVIELAVTEQKAAYYFTLDGEYYILSDSLRVLEIVSDEELMQNRHPDLLRIRLSGIRRAVVGQQLGFKSDGSYRYARRTLQIFAECTMTKYISLIDCSDKFGVFFIYDDRYRIVVGDTDNLETKLTYASAIISDLGSDGRGIINVDSGAAFYIAQSELEPA